MIIIIININNSYKNDNNNYNYYTNDMVAVHLRYFRPTICCDY